ncbi:MAG: hypothetical protein O2955_11875, partial [Planctomycetota bacterium]|nr:hypothetical protein [Planctomycetota bacterium]MDA1213209.1 hypothetical protein [Planctomycetota bacterium]
GATFLFRQTTLRRVLRFLTGVYTSVSFSRLDRIQSGKDPNTGKRLYITPVLYGPDLQAVKMAIVHHLGFLDLISGES